MKLQQNSYFLLSLLLMAISFSCEKRDFKEQPAVQTGKVSEITAKSASCNGSIIDLGSGIEDYGHCWSTSSQPTTSDHSQNLGKTTDIKTYTSKLEDLEPGVTYFVRAFAASKEDTYYGEEVSFTTLSGHAEVSTSDVIDISLFTAKCGGNVISGGGDEVTERGVCWDTTDLFGLSHSIGFTIDSLGLGSFESELSGLIPEKGYFVKSYAITTIDTTYGEIKSFSTLGGQETIVTTEATDITAIAVTCGGTIGEEWGETTIITKGVCWSTSQDPTIDDQKTDNGPGTGSFSGSITGLNPGTTYYVRVFVINSNGTYYGPQQSFTTLAGSVTLTTAPVSEITTASVASGGNIIDDGGAAITARGVCWSTSQNPTISDNKTNNGSGTGSFTSSINGLSPGTTYYVRAYATNSEGTYYGSQQSFTTLAGSVMLTTTSVTGISFTSAISGGNITDDGGAAITARGVCWSTSQNPTISDNKTSNGSGIGSFSSSITGLNPGTTYNVRAYATNSSGTYYGFQLSFSTPAIAVAPTVITSEISNIGSNSAQGGGNVSSDGGATVTVKGLCWSTSSNPTISDFTSNDGTGLGSFSSDLAGLSPLTTYYVRAYATNSAGTSYGSQMKFTTKWNNSTITDIDGNIYNTVQIGDQVWMQEALKVMHYADGEAIPYVESNSDWNDLGTTAKACCWYGNSASNGETYGVLYSWAAAMNGAASSNTIPSHVQGVCPAGWHLPSDEEWDILTDYLGGLNVAGGKLKETGTNHWTSPNTGATNVSGFTALPVGSRGDDGVFYLILDTGGWWSSTESSSYFSWSRIMRYDGVEVHRYEGDKDSAFAVRCMKD